jgi:hypothetical protein
VKHIKSYELRKLIFEAINPTIEIHRESDENYFWLEHNPCVTDQEIEDFIQSIPYFKQELKCFLLNDFPGVEEMFVTDEWQEEFEQKVKAWTESFEWLNGDGFC